MVSVVYILGPGSGWNNNEIRYSLRSVEKHLKGYGEVFIVGIKPDWMQNVIHIAVNDQEGTQYKESNIHRKIIAACNSVLVSDDFVLINDDHFFLQDMDADSMPYYYDGLITSRLKRDKNSYHISLVNTLTALRREKHDSKYFDIHCPILVNKAMYLHANQKYNWGIKRGYCIKSLYLNTIGEKGIPAKDFKVRSMQEIDLSRPYFSISDQALSPALERFMEELYPSPSKYEI
ncbi:MAG: hypothetical protein ACTHMM_10020 [Agriterribacter sp.]